MFSDIDLELKTCICCLKTCLVCHNESRYTLLHLLHRAAPSTGKVVCRGRLRLLWLWLKLVVQAISYTLSRSHTIKKSIYWFFLFLFFYWFLKKNHRYINIEFASFFKIEFDGIKLRKAVSDKPKIFKCKSSSWPFGPAIVSYQGVTLTSYPQMLICSVFVPDFYNLLLWKSLVFLHFQRTKDISYI